MVSIITVNFNQTELSCALLESIRRQEYKDLEIIVVDNGSTEDPTAVFQQRYPEARVFRSEKNLGFAGGNNRACREATGDFLFFVNNDAEITTGCIAQLRHFLEMTPTAGIVSPLICYYPTSEGSQPLVHPPAPRLWRANRPPAYAEASAGKPSAVGHPPSAVSRQPSAVGRPPSAVSRPPSAVRRPPSAVSRQPSAVRRPPSAVRRQPSAVRRKP